jgi:hypothetical protein
MATGYSAFAADYVEPAAFSPDESTRPIAAISEGEPTPAQALRWKSKSTPAIRGQVAESAELAPPRIASPAPSGGWNKTRIDAAVRQAQFTTDPFQDPFGDRGHTRQAVDLELVPTQSEPVRYAAPSVTYEELPAPTPRPIRGPAVPAGVPTEAEFIHQPTPSSPTPESGIPMPAVDLLPNNRTGTPCDRVYNDRNCCDIEAGCRTFRQQLLSDTLRTISLDITPRYMPDLSLEEDEATRADRLRLLESRAWRSKTGQILATGRMSNLLDGRVIVTDDSGAEVGRIPWSQLGDDELCYINAFWRLPVECALGGREVVSRCWIPSTFAWHASALCHKPLYFEEVQLERYGHTAGPFRQPFISGAHFIINLAALPYHMAYQPPHECQYALGYYRPGSCAPWMIPPVPLSLKGALAETGFVVGGIYILP